MRVTTMTPPHSKIEDVLCSKTRLKLLKLLIESEQLTVSEMGRRIGVNYASASIHLETLEKEDVLSHVMFGKRIRYYKFKESTRAQAVKKLIEAWSTDISR